MRSRLTAAIAIALTCGASPLLAHHTVAATYNVEKPVPLNGTIRAVEWRNPHIVVYLDAADTDGNVVSWKVELVGRMSGMRRSELKTDHPIMLTACVAKDGSHTAAAHTFSIPSTFENKRVGIC